MKMLTPEIQKHLQMALVAADEQLISDREEDRRTRAVDISKRGIGNSGAAVTVMCAVYEQWIAKRVERYASIYLDTLRELNVSIDDSIESEILNKLKAVSSITSVPQIPQLSTMADRAGLDAHLVQAVRSSGSRAVLSARVRISLAKLRQSQASTEKDPHAGAINYNVSGSNSRININSVDRSRNYIKAEVEEAADALMRISSESNRQELKSVAEEVKAATSSPSSLPEKLGKWVILASSSGTLMHQAMPWLEALYHFAAGN